MLVIIVIHFAIVGNKTQHLLMDNYTELIRACDGGERDITGEQTNTCIVKP